MKEGLLYAARLGDDLFIALPTSTKRSFIRHAQGLLGYPTFLETGTFKGAMARHASGFFQVVHTIELDPALAKRAAEDLLDLPNVSVHQGDSGRILPELLPMVGTSCLFWLDAHYSGGKTARAETDTPIIAELRAIAAHPVRPHAILIDDARVFGTDDAYPPLEQVIGLLREIDPTFKIGVHRTLFGQRQPSYFTSSGAPCPPEPLFRQAPRLFLPGTAPSDRRSDGSLQ